MVSQREKAITKAKEELQDWKYDAIERFGITALFVGGFFAIAELAKIAVAIFESIA